MFDVLSEQFRRYRFRGRGNRKRKERDADFDDSVHGLFLR
jgi:hypothetical protein